MIEAGVDYIVGSFILFLTTRLLVEDLVRRILTKPANF
jgi:hypothetical protein